jgi:hypothetical protein
MQDPRAARADLAREAGMLARQEGVLRATVPRAFALEFPVSFFLALDALQRGGALRK